MKSHRTWALALGLLSVAQGAQAARSAATTADPPSPLREITDLRLEMDGDSLDLHWPASGPCTRVLHAPTPYGSFVALEGLVFQHPGDDRTHWRFPVVESQGFYRVQSNAAPVGAITGEQEVSVDFFQQVVFDASASTDADGDSLAFRWEHDSLPTQFGPQLVLAAPLAEGITEWRLYANDGCQDSEALYLTVEYENPLPNGFCVSDFGDDWNPGTWDAPLASLEEALSRCTEEMHNIYLAHGLYIGQFTLTSNAHIYGGYSLDFHERDINTFFSEFRTGSIGTGTAMIGQSLENIVLDGLWMDIHAPVGAAPGTSVYGVLLTNCQSVTIRDCVILIHPAPGGSQGAPGASGAFGGGGGTGQPGCENGGTFCGTCSRPQGGNGGFSGAGNPGGVGGQAGLGGGSGFSGGSGPGGGGSGGLGGPSGGNGQVGQAGAQGQAGLPGAVGLLQFAATGVEASVGGTGTAGTAGRGGGGGGGGGGGTDGCDSYGSGGGSGGGGGGGGQPGSGGLPGGSTICVYLHGCTDVFIDGCHLASFEPGDGGNGGSGGSGGPGGAGGNGGPYGGPGEQDDAGNGGHGGQGGQGGPGGAGGPGQGGHSIAIYRSPGSLTLLDNLLYVSPGGQGGINAVGITAPYGISATVYP
jgi:hypothetical protein